MSLAFDLSYFNFEFILVFSILNINFESIPRKGIFYELYHIILMQVFSQPLFAFVEKLGAPKWPKNDFVTAEYDIPIPLCGVYQLNLFRLV